MQPLERRAKLSDAEPPRQSLVESTEYATEFGADYRKFLAYCEIRLDILDCRPEYLEAFEAMANLATKAAVEGPPATFLPACIAIRSMVSSFRGCAR